MKRRRAVHIDPPPGTEARALAAEPAPSARYPASWINRLADRVDRLPGPPWLVYGALAVLLSLLQIGIQAAAGRTVNAFNLVVAVTVPYLLWLMHYLIRTAARALEEFQPALSAGPDEAVLLRYRLTTLPSRPVTLVSLAATVGCVFLILAVSTLDPVAVAVGHRSAGSLMESTRMFQIASTPLSVGFASAIMVASWWVMATYVFLTIHQLRQISSIYARHTEIRLFRLGPLYAFSRHTLRSSLGLLVLAYADFATARQVLEAALGLGFWLLLIAGAIGTFLVPLLGIHRRLAREKDHALHEIGLRLEACVASLHQRLDRNDLADIDGLNKAMAMLEIERVAVDRVPTWPWERGTVRGLTAAIGIPLAVWILQALLQRVFGS